MNEKYIYIHIGIHKTGTSAIQDFISLNKPVFSKKGFLYPQKSRRDYWERVNGEYIVTSSKARNFAKLEKIRRRKCKHVILSSETFTLIKNISVIGRVLQESPVKIICYLRRQDDLKQSMYNQSVKTGFSKDISEYDQYPMDYYSLLEKWSAVFGKNNMIVRLYEKEQLKNGNLIEDFLDIFGLELTKEYRELQGNVNPHLCPEALEYMKLLNRIWKDKAVTEIFFKGLLAFSVQKRTDNSCGFFSQQHLLTRDQRTAILEQYRTSNALVAQVYLNRKDGRLFDQALPDDTLQALSREVLDKETTREITEYLWQKRKSRKALIRIESMDFSDANERIKGAKAKILTAIKQMRQRN